MDLTAFNARLGQDQGRLETEELEQSAVFILGSSEPGHFHELASGDQVFIEQPLDLTDLDFIRADLHLTVPQSTPEGYAWEASIIVDGVPLASARCRRGQARRLTDLVANVSKRRGVTQVGVRLALWEG